MKNKARVAAAQQRATLGPRDDKAGWDDAVNFRALWRAPLTPIGSQAEPV